MSRRFGRNQKRKLREQVVQLAESRDYWLVEVREARDEIVLARREIRQLRASPDGRWRTLAETAAEALSEFVPKKVCRCHLSPPCNDCVEYGGAREIIGDIRDAAAKESNP